MAYVTISSGVSNAPWARLYVDVTSQSISGNYSNVKWTLKLFRPYSISSSSSKDYYVLIEGDKVKASTYSINGSGEKVIASGTKKCYHSSSGALTLNFGAKVEFGVTFHGHKITSYYKAGSVAVKTIPRAATISGVSKTVALNSQGEGTLDFTSSLKSTSFKHSIEVKIGNHTQTASVGSSTTYHYAIKSDAAIKNPTLATMTGTIVLITKTSGGSEVGRDTESFTVTLDSSVKPQFSGPLEKVLKNKTILDTTTAFKDGYLAGVTALQLSAPVSSQLGATITSVTYELGPQTYTATKSPFSVTTPTLTAPGTYTCQVIARDSRGRTSTLKADDVIIQNYFFPKIKSLSLAESNSQIIAKVAGIVSDVTVNGVSNYKKLVYRWKVDGESTFPPENIKEVTLTDPKWDFLNETLLPLDISSANYYVEARLFDRGGEDIDIEKTGSATLSFLAGGNGITLFKEAEQEGFWVKDIHYDLEESIQGHSKFQELMLLMDYNIDALEKGSIYFDANVGESDSKMSILARIRTKGMIEALPNTQYSVEMKTHKKRPLYVWVYEYNADRVKINHIANSNQVMPFVFTTNVSTAYLRFLFTYYDNSAGTEDTAYEINLVDLYDGFLRQR